MQNKQKRRKVPLYAVIAPEVKTQIQKIVEEKRNHNPDLSEGAVVRELLSLGLEHYSYNLSG